MESLLLLFLIPLLIGGAAFLIYRATISWQEFVLMEVLAGVLIFLLFLVARCGSMQDVEHWNGRIVSKHHGTQACCHCSLVCTSRGPKGACTAWKTVCSHFHDYWWSVSVSTGDTLEDTCNGGSWEPQWWTHARIGEPASVEHSYQNYLLADPESLFHHKTAHKQYMNDVPDHFPEIHDRYRAPKLIVRGVPTPQGWEKELLEINADLGASKEIDLIIYLTKVEDPTYADAVEEKWVYGPKNALIIVLGVPDGTTIAWARAVTISRVETLKIEVRDTLPGKKLDDPTILPTLRGLVEKLWKRTPMDEFEYLASAAKPRGWGLFLLYLGSIAISVGLVVWVHREDVFGTRWNRNLW